LEKEKVSEGRGKQNNKDEIKNGSSNETLGKYEK
jgi:hypothetical protein